MFSSADRVTLCPDLPFLLARSARDPRLVVGQSFVLYQPAIPTDVPDRFRSGNIFATCLLKPLPGPDHRMEIPEFWTAKRQPIGE